MPNMSVVVIVFLRSEQTERENIDTVSFICHLDITSKGIEVAKSITRK